MYINISVLDQYLDIQNDKTHNFLWWYTKYYIIETYSTNVKIYAKTFNFISDINMYILMYILNFITRVS